MYWLLLPVAFATLWFGLRTTSPGMMAVWLAVTAVLVMLWTYFRFRAVFPGGAGSSDSPPAVTRGTLGAHPGAPLSPLLGLGRPRAAVHRRLSGQDCRL